MSVGGGTGGGASLDTVGAVRGEAAESVGFDGRVFAGSIEGAPGAGFVETPGGQGGADISVVAGDALGAFEGADDEFVGVFVGAEASRSFGVLDGGDRRGGGEFVVFRHGRRRR